MSTLEKFWSRCHETSLIPVLFLFLAGKTFYYFSDFFRLITDYKLMIVSSLAQEILTLNGFFRIRSIRSPRVLRATLQSLIAVQLKKVSSDCFLLSFLIAHYFFSNLKYFKRSSLEKTL